MTFGERVTKEVVKRMQETRFVSERLSTCLKKGDIRLWADVSSG